jgi:hypothetical protein
MDAFLEYTVQYGERQVSKTFLKKSITFLSVPNAVTCIISIAKAASLQGKLIIFTLKQSLL